MKENNNIPICVRIHFNNIFNNGFRIMTVGFAWGPIWKTHSGMINPMKLSFERFIQSLRNLRIRLKFQNFERRFPILGFANDTNPWCLHHWCHHTCHKPLIMNVWHDCQRSTTPCLLTMSICFVERFPYNCSVRITLVIVTKISFLSSKGFSKWFFKASDGDSDVGDMVMLVTLWWWLIWD